MWNERAHCQNAFRASLAKPVHPHFDFAFEWKRESSFCFLGSHLFWKGGKCSFHSLFLFSRWGRKKKWNGFYSYAKYWLAPHTHSSVFGDLPCSLQQVPFCLVIIGGFWVWMSCWCESGCDLALSFQVAYQVLSICLGISLFLIPRFDKGKILLFRGAIRTQNSIEWMG